MKTAATAFAVTALFLVAVVMGIGRSEASGEPGLPAIELRQDGPAATPTTEPDDGTEKVERKVDDSKVDDYEDDGKGRGRGRGRGGDDDSGGGEDDSGHGGSGSGGGEDHSGHGGGDDDSSGED